VHRLEGDVHAIGCEPLAARERLRDLGHQVRAARPLHAVDWKVAALCQERRVIVRMVVAGGGDVPTPGHEVLDQLHAGEHDVVALRHAESAAVRIVDGMERHKVALHVDHDKCVIWADGSGTGWRSDVEQSDVLIKERGS
jgi:hypothetical protein